jgi:hypothetical protein
VIARGVSILQTTATKANIRRICYDCLDMARRPEFPAKAMTREELRELKRSLSLLSPHTVQDNYTELLASCRLRDGTPPAASNDAATCGAVENSVAMARIMETESV